MTATTVWVWTKNKTTPHVYFSVYELAADIIADRIRWLEYCQRRIDDDIATTETASLLDAAFDDLDTGYVEPGTLYPNGLLLTDVDELHPTDYTIIVQDIDITYAPSPR